jgi:type IV pilus assembly protein PilN
MIRINLLPPEIHIAEVRKQMSALGGIAGGLVVVLLLAFWGSRALKANNLEGELKKANEELAKYQAIVDKVNQLEQTRNQLKARRDVIQTLLKGRLLFPKFFEDFMRLLPDEIWISNLSSSPDPKQAGAMTVSVSAQSTSNFAIADWLTNLQASPYVSEVNLGTISADEAAEGRAPVLSFTLRFRYFREDV